MPMVDAGLLVSPQHPADFGRDLCCTRRPPQKQTRKDLAHLRHRRCLSQGLRRFARAFRALWFETDFLGSERNLGGSTRSPRDSLSKVSLSLVNSYRRHSKDHERTIESSETMIYISMIQLMTRRWAAK